MTWLKEQRLIQQKSVSFLFMGAIRFFLWADGLSKPHQVFHALAQLFLGCDLDAALLDGFLDIGG